MNYEDAMDAPLRPAITKLIVISLIATALSLPGILVALHWALPPDSILSRAAFFEIFPMTILIPLAGVAALTTATTSRYVWVKDGKRMNWRERAWSRRVFVLALIGLPLSFLPWCQNLALWLLFSGLGGFRGAWTVVLSFALASTLTSLTVSYFAKRTSTADVGLVARIMVMFVLAVVVFSACFSLIPSMTPDVPVKKKAVESRRERTPVCERHV